MTAKGCQAQVSLIFVLMDWILTNWAEIALALLAFADVLVSLNPKWTGTGLGYIRAVVTALAATATASKKRKTDE